MVTKQQQLEWLAKKYERWPVVDEYVVMNGYGIGIAGGAHYITKGEWQQERDKMQKQAEQQSRPSQDNSWHERGELPPVGCECEWVDESGVEVAAGSLYPRIGDVVSVCAHKQTPGGDVIAIFTWEPGDNGLRVAASRMPEDFRPLRTEREKAIDEMVGVIKGAAFQDPEFIASILYDAGYRRVKP